MNLRFDLMDAAMIGKDGHAQETMKELGITYKSATPQSLADQWWFFDCENVPSELPEYLTVMEKN